MQKIKIKSLLLVFCCFLLVAVFGCGGGKGTTTTQPPAPSGDYYVYEVPTTSPKAMKMVPITSPICRMVIANGPIGSSIPDARPVPNAIITFSDGTAISADAQGRFNLDNIPTAIKESALASSENAIEVLVEKPQTGKLLGEEKKKIPEPENINVDKEPDEKEVITGLKIIPSVSAIEKGDYGSYRLAGETEDGKPITCVSKTGGCQIEWKILKQNGTEDTSGSVLQIASVSNTTRDIVVKAIDYGRRTLQAKCISNCPDGLQGKYTQAQVFAITDFLQFIGSLKDEQGAPLTGDNWIVLFRVSPPKHTNINRRVPQPGKGCFSATDLGAPADLGACLYTSAVLLPSGNTADTGNLDIQVLIGEKDPTTKKTTWYKVKDGNTQDNINIDETNSSFSLALPANDMIDTIAGTQIRLPLIKTNTPYTPTFNPPQLHTIVKDAWEQIQNVMENPPYKPGSGVRQVFAKLDGSGTILTGTYKDWTYDKTGNNITLTSPDNDVKIKGSRTEKPDGSKTYILETIVKLQDDTEFTVRKIEFTDKFTTGILPKLKEITATSEFYVPPKGDIPVKKIVSSLTVDKDSDTGESSFTFTDKIYFGNRLGKEITGTETINLANRGSGNPVFSFTGTAKVFVKDLTNTLKEVATNITLNINGLGTGTANFNFTYPDGITSQVTMNFQNIIPKQLNAGIKPVPITSPIGKEIAFGEVGLNYLNTMKTAEFEITNNGKLTMKYADLSTEMFVFQSGAQFDAYESCTGGCRN